MSAQFDQHARTYTSEVDSSVSFTGQDVDFFARRKADELVRTVSRHLGPTEGLSALDVGCGVGVTDRHLAGRFAQLSGTDLSADAVEQARAASPGVDYRHQTGASLPFDDESFDVAFAICVLHHVEPPDRAAFTRDLVRTLRPGGMALIFEHNPFNPLTRVAVSRCEFDEGVTLLRPKEAADLLTTAGLEVRERNYILFVPLEARWAQRVDRSLRRVPLGGQHYAAAVKPGPARVP